MDAPIRIEGVSKRFRLQAEQVGSIKEAITQRLRPTSEDFWALRDVNLEIPRGSMFALIGHNGSGKSTLLRCVAGIYRPTSGTIHTEGRISALLELGAGFHPDLTGRENIQLNAAILGLKKDEIAESFDDIVDFAGVREFLDVPIKHFSSGMTVRLGFAVAVHLKPEILIIDEVIAVGDEEFQRRCFDFLYQLRRKGVTIVVVSHSLELIRSLCDEAAWLEHGRVMASGPVGDVVKAYVSRVNDLEADRDTTEGADGDSMPGRTGSGEVRISRIELLDGLGAPVPNVVHGDPATIRLHYVAAEDVEDALFGLTIYHENGTFVMGTSTHLAGIRTGHISGRGHIDYKLDAVRITPGRYQLGIAIQDRHAQHHFDLVERYGGFAVRLGTGTAARGLVDLAGDWGTPVVGAGLPGGDESTGESTSSASIEGSEDP
ncbi:MAG: ABC transporter ATP-binding protein [Microthrixaceae bacterium]|nr:ABC transporter ATP-binding protein [Microthrixaceae bacterium]MCO5320443.1 ABC transporter ATP-binding protein [Microthrixaceae bacterium]